jgi:hypothetical protein
MILGVGPAHLRAGDYSPVFSPNRFTSADGVPLAGSLGEWSDGKGLLIRRGMHAGLLYLQDPHWFGLGVLNYLKHWQARDAEHVTTAVPPLDVLAEATLDGKTATYRFLVRNHGTKPVGPLEVHLGLPGGAALDTCWLGGEGLGRCAKEGNRLTWILPRLSGGKATAGPFVAVADVSRLKPGRFEAEAWVEHPGALRQELPLEKP